jgi:hypothetical protein
MKLGVGAHAAKLFRDILRELIAATPIVLSVCRNNP